MKALVDMANIRGLSFMVALSEQVSELFRAHDLVRQKLTMCMISILAKECGRGKRL